MQQTISKLQEKSSEELRKSSQRDAGETALCLLKPHYFLREYAWIENKNTAKTVKWEPWDFQLTALDDFLKYDEIVIPKARQLGISWLVAGYCLWIALFRENAKVLFISQGEEEAWDMVAKCHFIWEHLPSFLRLPINHDTKSMFDFVGNSSEVRALPSTEKAGRSTNATIVVRDELAYHPYARENFSAIGPTIDGGGQAIDLSTIDSTSIEDHFTERVQKARSGESNAHLIDLCNWRLRPVRQEGLTLDEWFEARIRPKYEKWEIEREYPESLDQALAPPKVTCRFDVQSITEMKAMCEPVVKFERNGLVRIYKEPIAGLKYTLVCDPSEGSEDPAAGMVVEFRSRAKVADYHGKIPLNEQAEIAYDFYERYKKPFTAVERNAQGILLVDKLSAMGITNWYYHDKSKDKEGWWTSSQNRPVMITDLAEDVRLKQFYEPSEDALNQFLSFIRTQKKPDGEARKGTHDEFVIMWAIEGQIRKHMTVKTGEIRSSRYGEVWRH